jgi:molecular chaperone DnaK
MSAGNKSLGRIKLTGIPPAPRGVPQIQVAFDIDANGILQVTARDKTTGREQSIIVQGASSLSESEVNRMIVEAEKFSSEDRQRRERVEKRNQAKALTDQVQRRIKEVTLDFGSQFTSGYRRQAESISAEVLDSLEKGDERRLDRAQSELQDLLYQLNREVRLQYEDEEDDGFLGTIKRTFVGDDKEEDYPPIGRRNMNIYRDESPRYERESRRATSRNSDDSYYQDDEYPRGRRSRNIPPENNWDDEDDNWY